MSSNGGAHHDAISGGLSAIGTELNAGTDDGQTFVMRMSTRCELFALDWIAAKDL